MSYLKNILIVVISVLALSGIANAEVLKASGKITLLRVHDVGNKYGPPSDEIDVEDIFNLDSEPGKAFGFQLRDDANKAAREGMLSLLRDAFNNNRIVNFDYEISPGKRNGVIIRVWLGSVVNIVTGNLRVTINGIPGTVTSLPVKITGPGFSRSINRTTILTELIPSSYTISATPFTTGAGHPACRIHTPDINSQLKTVSENQTANASVSYTSVRCDID